MVGEQFNGRPLTPRDTNVGIEVGMNGKDSGGA